MQDQNRAEKDIADASRIEQFVKSSSLFYFAMAGVGFLICTYRHKSFAKILAIPSDPKEALTLLALGVMGALVLLIANFLFEEQFPTYKAFRHVLMRMVGAATLPAALYLAAISAIGEEALFRGAIQPVLGIVGSALLFGLLHLGPQGFVSIWTLWAVLSGLLFSWLFDETGSLWPSLICHFLVNAASMIRLRIQYRKFLVTQAQDESKKANAKLISGH